MQKVDIEDKDYMSAQMSFEDDDENGSQEAYDIYNQKETSSSSEEDNSNAMR